MSERDTDDAPSEALETSGDAPASPIASEDGDAKAARLGAQWTVIDPEGRIRMFADEEELRASLTPPPVAPVEPRPSPDDVETQPAPEVEPNEAPAGDEGASGEDDDEPPPNAEGETTQPLSLQDVVLATPGPMPVASVATADGDASSDDEAPKSDGSSDEDAQPLSLRDVIAVAPVVSMPPPVPTKASKAAAKDEDEGDGPPREDKPLGELLNAATAPLTPERILAATSIAPPKPRKGEGDKQAPALHLPQKGELKPTPTVRESDPPRAKNDEERQDDADDEAPRSKRKKSGAKAGAKKTRKDGDDDAAPSSTRAKANTQTEEPSSGDGWKYVAALAVAAGLIWYFGFRDDSSGGTKTEPTAAPTTTTTASPSVEPSSSAMTETSATASATPPAPSSSVAATATSASAGATHASAPAGATSGDTKPAKGAMSMADMLVAAHKARASGDRAKAKEYYDRVLHEVGPNVEAWSGLGDIARAQGELGVAKARYQNALGMSPQYGPALLGLADTQWALGEQEAARTLYKQILGRSPNAPARVRERANPGATQPTTTGAPPEPTATATATATAPPAPTAPDPPPSP